VTEDDAIFLFRWLVVQVVDNDFDLVRGKPRQGKIRAALAAARLARSKAACQNGDT
jgi:hypothetical protein